MKPPSRKSSPIRETKPAVDPSEYDMDYSPPPLTGDAEVEPLIDKPPRTPLQQLSSGKKRMANINNMLEAVDIQSSEKKVTKRFK